jgi:hypothetical protein
MTQEIKELKCKHEYIEYYYKSWKDSEQVDGVQVTWKCDDCAEKGIHHFEFYEEDAVDRDNEIYAKFERKIMRDPKRWTGYTKKELRQELREYAEEQGYDEKDINDEFDFFDEWILNEAGGLCEHTGFEKDDIGISYDILTLTQTCPVCGYIRDLKHNRKEMIKT